MTTQKLQIKKRVVCKCKVEELPMHPKNNGNAKALSVTYSTIPTSNFTVITV